MANWERIEVELDKKGIYCSYGEYLDTDDYCLFITRADGKSLMDYFYKKECLDILNMTLIKTINKSFETFEDFLKANNFQFKENDLGKYLVLRNLKELEHKDDFHLESYIASFYFIAKAMLKLMVLSLALYLKCEAIYSNNEIIGLGKEYERNDINFDTKEIGNIISEIINEVYEENIVKNLTANTFRKTFDKTFNLELSNIYGKLKTNIETLSKEYHIKGNIYKVKNEENPAYLQKINKVDFLTNNYYYFDKRKRQRFENRFKFISEDNLGNEEKELSKKLKEYFTKTEEVTEKKMKDNNICCSYGVFKNSYGIFFNYTNETEKSQKTIFSYLSTPAFLKIFNESFETPFKSFDEFLELNNFRILETDDFKYIELLEIERYEDGSLRNYPKGFSAYAQLLCVFLGIKLSEYMYKHFKEFLHNSFNKVYVNIEIKNKISYSEKIEEFELLRKENFFDEIQTEMKKEDFQRVNLERLNTILKGNNTSIQMIKVVMTKTYIRLEKMIKKILKKSVVEVDLIEQKNNLAYKLMKKEEEKK